MNMKFWHLLFAIVLVLLLANSHKGRCDIPSSLQEELAPSFALPKGNYLLIRSLEAEKDFSHNGGVAVSDNEASAGQAWEANPQSAQSGNAVVFGPYIELEGGNYVALFRLKLLEDADDEPVATIDACVDYAKTMLNQKTIYGSDLPLNRYVYVPLPFH
ncbi:MAG: hypothetical protein ACPLSK_01125, partial [bacterium]